MSGIEPMFVAAECSIDCEDRLCPYSHFGGWAIDGVEGLFDSPEEARAAATDATSRAPLSEQRDPETKPRS